MSNTTPESALARNKEQESRNHCGSSTANVKDNLPETIESSIPIDEKSIFFDLPPNIEFRESETRGRGIYAKAPIAAGTTVLSFRPTIYTLLTKEIAYHCTNCTHSSGEIPAGPNPSDELKKCTGCKVVRYCGAECQSVDWPDHKRECAALRRWAARNEKEGGELGIAPDEDVRGIARLIWKRKKMGMDSIWSKQLDGMKSHPVLERDYVRIGAICEDLKKYMSLKGVEDLPSLFIPDEDVLIQLIIQFDDNNFALHNQFLRQIGICCSPLVALVNHSCDSNLSTRFFKTPGLETEKTGAAVLEPEAVGLILDMIVFRDIAAGDEMTMSYIPTSHSTAWRRETLGNFGFICKCPICEPHIHGRTDMDWRETLICPQNCGGACPIPESEAEYPAKCKMCGVFSSVKPAPLSVLRQLGEEALEKANKLGSSGNWDEGIAIARGAISLLEPIFTPCTEPLYELCSLQQSMLAQSLSGLNPIPSGPYNELARMASLNVFAAQKLFRPGHPARAKTLAEAGCLWALTTNTFDPTTVHEINIDLHLQRLAKAKLTLLQALDELQCGWGKKREGGILHFRVRNGLARAERDLNLLTLLGGMQPKKAEFSRKE